MQQQCRAEALERPARLRRRTRTIIDERTRQRKSGVARRGALGVFPTFTAKVALCSAQFPASQFIPQHYKGCPFV